MKPGTTGAISTPRVDARVRAVSDRAESLERMRRSRLERRPCLLVHRGTLMHTVAAAAFDQLGEQIRVAHDHRSLRNEADRRPPRQRLERARG